MSSNCSVTRVYIVCNALYSKLSPSFILTLNDCQQSLMVTKTEFLLPTVHYGPRFKYNDKCQDVVTVRLFMMLCLIFHQKIQYKFT